MNSDQFDHEGVLVAKGDIHTLIEGSPRTIETNREVAVANANSGGRVVANSGSNFSIFDLDPSQLKLPADQNSVTVPSGRWNFVRVPARVTYRAHYLSASDTSERGTGIFTIDPPQDQNPRSVSKTDNIWIDVLEHYDPPDASTPKQIYRGAYRTEDLIAGVEREHVETSYEKDNVREEHFLLDPERPPETESFVIEGYEDTAFRTVNLQEGLVFESEGGASFRFDLTNQRVLADAVARVEVEGPLHLTSASNTPPPVLDLGFSPQPGAPQRATVMAKGDIDISNGVTRGLGALISEEGDVRIQPSASSRVDVDGSGNDTGLVIYSAENVELSNPDGSKDWSFTGLVYARGDVLMQGKAGENVSFEGAVVSLAESVDGVRTQGIRFENCGQVEFIYNPELLDALIEAMPGNRIEVQTFLWKE